MTGPHPDDLFAAHAAHTMRSGHGPQDKPPTPGPGPAGTASEHAAHDLLTALLHWIYAYGGDPETAVADAYHRWQNSMLATRAATRPHLPAPPLPPPLPQRPFTLLHHLLALLGEPPGDHGDLRSELEQLLADQDPDQRPEHTDPADATDDEDSDLP